jgi:cobyrinic acid a,c-diamide synthase
MPGPLSAMVVAGTHSGVGKTTVTLGLLAALRRRGLTVQPFKVGPDFIDLLHHRRAAGRNSRSLDGWMLEPEVNRGIFARHTADADAAVVEGVMGFYDGSGSKDDRGSTAEMAKLLDLPVLLVIDAAAMARSAAALIHGFVSFDPQVRFAGVILNRVGGERHAEMIREAVGDAIPILGALPRASDLVVPERHLGLHLPHEANPSYIDRAADLIEDRIDLDQLLAGSRVARRVTEPRLLPRPRAVRIGVARDEAFCFYYEDNLELLAESGAELIEFSPIRDRLPADLDGVYLGGGYPELHADELADNIGTKASIRELARAGAPIYAECGGMMYLAEHLHVDAGSHAMCGVLPLSTRMPGKLHLGYVEVTTTGGLFGAGQTVRGHVYHHSELEGRVEAACTYRVRTSRGEASEEGYSLGNALGSYIHLHFAGNPAVARTFVEACETFRLARSGRFMT